MTSVWGPLGWLTLHSVATSYPETPTEAERRLMESWLDMFRDTITCAYCRGHFAELLAKYRSLFPNMLYSRQEFVVFSFRAHNAVNARLMKPIYGSLDECLVTLRKATESRPARDYRVSYLAHILRYWRSYQDITGISAVKKVFELNRIEADYIAPRDTKFEVSLRQDVVVLPSSAFTQSGETPTGLRLNPRGMPDGGRIRLGAGGFRLQR
jgi:hypothetical protein